MVNSKDKDKNKDKNKDIKKDKKNKKDKEESKDNKNDSKEPEITNEIIDQSIEKPRGMQILLLSNLLKYAKNDEGAIETYNEDFDEDYNEEYEKKEVERKRKIKNFEKVNVNYKYYASDEKHYFENLNPKKRKLIGTIEKDTNLINDVDTPIRFKILDLCIDNKYKAIALKKIEGMNNKHDGEYFKKKTWIDNFCKIPFGKIKNLPVSSTNSKEKISDFLSNTKKILDENIYGNNDAKEQFLRILAQWIANPKSKGNVIGLHGSPGTGKTVFMKEGVCKALDLPFAFIPLGGVNDGAYLTGHSFTYEGAVHSKLIDVIIKAGYMNPIIYFDELDKVSTSNRGQEIINTLIHLTDPVQNEKFCDKYFYDVDFDFSKALIIFTYNDSSLVNPILKDRMITINIDKYTITDKTLIAKDYMMPNMIKQFNLKIDEIIFKEENIRYLINKTEKEDGVRNLKRNIELLLSTINLLKITGNHEIFNLKKIKIETPIDINQELIDKLIKLKVSSPSIDGMYM